MIHIYVKDVDGFCSQAVAAGAKLKRAVADQFYGDRSGQLEDPFGHIWNIGTRIENLTAEEMIQRASAHQK